MKLFFSFSVALILMMSATSTDAQFGGAVINYASTSGTVTTLDSVPSNPGIECYGHEAGGGGGGGGDRAKNGQDRPAAVPAPDTTSVDECWNKDEEEAKLSGGGDNQQAYDTALSYLTLCYNQRDAIGMFFHASGDNGERSNDLNRFVEFREWLKSVLYLRTDTDWYCADVVQMVATMADYYDSVHGGYPNGQAAIDRYILEHNRCDSVFAVQFANDLSYYPRELYTVWRDTVKDSIKIDTLKNSLGMDSIVDSILYPDTTVPSIDSIGLSILRGPQYAGIKETPLPEGTDHINDLYVTENPFTNATAIKFTLADYGLVTFQLFDVLGHAVTTNGIGQVLYPGEHEFDIDGSKLPPGNYIARVAFHNGDVESILVEKK
jgi:hypothetical protein